MFVAVKQDGTLAAHHLDRGDFGGEPACGERMGGAALAFQREGVLISAGDAVPRGDIFGRDPHVARPEGAGQRAGHHVDGAGIAHLLAKAGGGQDVGSAGHAFRPADKGQIGIAQHQRLRA